MKRLIEKYKDELAKLNEYDIGGKTIHVDLSEIPNDLDTSELSFSIREQYDRKKLEIHIADKNSRYRSWDYPRFIVKIPNWIEEVLKRAKIEGKKDLIDNLINSLPEQDQEQYYDPN